MWFGEKVDSTEGVLNHDSYSHLIESYCDLYSAIRRTRLSMRERV